MLTFSRFVIGSVAALILGASVPAAGKYPRDGPAHSY